jgi:hypothetical protein
LRQSRALSPLRHVEFRPTIRMEPSLFDTQEWINLLFPPWAQAPPVRTVARQAVTASE